MNQTTSYIGCLTPLRGIAAIWVMLFHIDVILFYREFGYLISRDASGILSKGYLWVDFFFLLSGFIISHVYGEALSKHWRHLNSLRSFLWSRFSKIYPLSFFTLVLLIPYAIVFPLISPSVVDGSWQTFFAWSALFDNLLLINAMNQHNYLSWNIVAWSIGAEWWAYVAACLLIPFIYQKSWWRCVLISVAAFATLIALVHHKGNLDITFDYGWIRCIASFCIGAVLYQIYLNKIGNTWLAMNGSFLLSLLFIVSVFHFHWPDLLAIPAFCILLLSAAWNHGTVKKVMESKPLRYLGDISYSIYMMHGVWFMVFWFCLPYLRVAYGIQQFTGWMIVVYVLLFVALTLSSAHFTYHYIELKGKLLFKRFATK